MIQRTNVKNYNCIEPCVRFLYFCILKKNCSEEYFYTPYFFNAGCIPVFTT